MFVSAGVHSAGLPEGHCVKEVSLQKSEFRHQVRWCSVFPKRGDFFVFSRPCILVMDSLKLSYHENVCRLLREWVWRVWHSGRSNDEIQTAACWRAKHSLGLHWIYSSHNRDKALSYKLSLTKQNKQSYMVYYANDQTSGTCSFSRTGGFYQSETSVVQQNLNPTVNMRLSVSSLQHVPSQHIGDRWNSFKFIIIIVIRYLQVEWEVRRGTPRLFTSDNMKSSNCRVPLQDNSSDCGLYLLQYAESFLQVTTHLKLDKCFY